MKITSRLKMLKREPHKAFDKLPKFDYNEDSLRKVLNEKLQNAVSEGTITPEEATTIRSDSRINKDISQRPQPKPEVKPIGEGEIKASKLGLRVEQTAIEKRFTQELEIFQIINR